MSEVQDQRTASQAGEGGEEESSADAEQLEVEATEHREEEAGSGYRGAPGNFVIEGGDVEHEELDEEEAEMPALAEHFLNKYSGEHQKPVQRLSAPALRLFMRPPGAPFTQSRHESIP